ncbi:MAG: glycosyltransferase family 4 protein [Rhodospirillaceae bacterium]
MARKFGIGWQVGGTTGWGVYGLSLMLQGARRGLVPVPVYISPKFSPDPLEERLLAPLNRHWYIEQEFFALADGEDVHTGYPFLLGLGNDLAPADVIARIGGDPDIGVAFFEHRAIDPGDVARAKERYAAIIAGSSWNAEVLRDLGFENVHFCPQGIDPTRFHPAPKGGGLSDRFVVFSGGKLEFRKGQDIVVEVFRRFRERHPEALLMLAWHNHWDESVASLRLSPHGTGSPQRGEDGTWKISEWLASRGIPPDAVLDLGEVANAAMPRLLRECDVGLFPNRCEGGTNLVAMECMACGVPAILSANTGHRDLLAREGAALALTAQGAVKGGPDDDPGLFLDWGETDPDEALDRLEWVHAHRGEAAHIGRRGAAFLREWAWPEKIDALFAALGWV